MLNRAHKGAVLVAVLVGASACSTVGQHPASEGLASGQQRAAGRSPASDPTVLRRLLAAATDQGLEWLTALLGKESGREAKAMAIQIKKGLVTLRPDEIRQNDQLLKVLKKEVSELTEADARYLLDFALQRIKSADAPRPEVQFNAQVSFQNRKIIRDRLIEVAGNSRESRNKVIGLIQHIDILVNRGMIEPERAKQFVMAIQAEKWRGQSSELGALVDTIQSMLVSVGGDIDPKAAAQIINTWPEPSLVGLRNFYTELTMVQAETGLGIQEAADVVLKKFGITEAEEAKAMKVCSLIKAG
ncbi:MAG: hypothetical protein ACK5QT_00715 [Oligoflexia bacterium]